MGEETEADNFHTSKPIVCNNAGTVSNIELLKATVDRFSNDQAIQDAKYNVAIQEIQDAHVEWLTLKGLVQLRPWSVEGLSHLPTPSQHHRPFYSDRK